MNLENLDVVAMDATEMVDVDGGLIFTTAGVCIGIAVGLITGVPIGLLLS